RSDATEVLTCAHQVIDGHRRLPRILPALRIDLDHRTTTGVEIFPRGAREGHVRDLRRLRLGEDCLRRTAEEHPTAQGPCAPEVRRQLEGALLSEGASRGAHLLGAEPVLTYLRQLGVDGLL